RFRVRAPAISLEVFLGSVESRTSVLYFLHRHRLGLLNGFAYSTPSLLGHTLPSVRFFILLRHPVAQTIARWYRIIHLLSIAYAFRPQHRSRLTLCGLTFLMNPYAFYERDSRFYFVTHTGILTSHALHKTSRSCFPARRTLSYRCSTGIAHSFGDT